MVLRLTARCLDDWVESFDTFNHQFRLYTLSFAKCVGYAFTFDGEALQIAHRNWVAKCELWEKTLVMPNSNGLSHIKMLAVLLHELTAVGWLKDLCEFDGEDRDGLEFAGSREEREEIRNDINGGGEVYLAFQFVVMVINFFEAARTDRDGAFSFKLTPSLEHDMMVYLKSGQPTEMAIFLVLEGLYTRPRKLNGEQ
ncbi:MAG: hypothetical protein ACM3YN_02515 [Parcubacteria group bacterium]